MKIYVVTEDLMYEGITNLYKAFYKREDAETFMKKLELKDDYPFYSITELELE